MGHEEEAIAKAQAAAAKSKGADALNEHHKWNIADLDQRILVIFFTIALVGLVSLWMTAKSELVLYGSLAAVIVLVIFWGMLRLKRIQRLRQQRAEQAKSWESDHSQ